MNQKDINEARELAKFKRDAFYAGTHKKMFSDFRLEGLQKTDFPAGKYMEVVVAWMLGYFRKITGLYLKVDIKWEEDLFEATDFKIATNDTDFRPVRINLKFDRDGSSDAADFDSRYITARTYPAAPGHADSKKTQNGMEAMHSILSCVFEESTIIRAFEGREELVGIMMSVWDVNSQNW